MAYGKLYKRNDLGKKEMKMKILAYALLFLVLLIPAVFAEDQVVINSKNWQDVYSGSLYANLRKLDWHYVAEESHGVQLINEVLNRDKKKMLLLESGDEPFIFGLESKMKEVGFEVEKFTSIDGKETNLELAQRIVAETGLDSFIIVDGNLGYNALSVTPYALLTTSFVLFADRGNIEEMENFLDENARRVILYGHVNREVKERLAKFNPEIISTGDRHQDNLEIVAKFLEERNTQQVILTNGEVIEPGIFNREFPVLFIGTTNVPQQVIDFIQESDLRTAIVIGYDLFANAKKIRELTGIRIFLKYGQGRNEQLYALDIFPLPSYNPEVNIKTVRYNTAIQQLEVIYENKGEVFAYVQALSHDLKVKGLSVAEVGDESAIFLDGREIRTVTYDVNLNDYLDETIEAESKIVLGDTPASLVKLLTIKSAVEVITAKDDSRIEISSVVYNKGTKRFEITIKNRGEEEVHADAEILDLMIAEEKVTLGAEQQRIQPGRKGIFKIKALLEEVDLEDNVRIKVRIRYGAREDALIKSLTQEFALVIKSGNYKLALLVGMVLVILWLYSSLRKKRRRTVQQNPFQL